MRHPCRILLLFFTAFFFGWGTAPLLHSQESMADQSTVRRSAVHGDGTEQIRAADAVAVAEVPEAVFSEAVAGPAERVSQDPQNPEPPAQNNSNVAATYQPVTWKNLPGRVLGDQKLVWLYPMHLARGQYLLPTLGVVGATGGLIAADPHIMVHVRNTTAFHEFDEIFSGANTGAFTVLVPATFYAYGLVCKDSYAEQTALLAGEAYIDSMIPHVAIKLVSRRLRPNAVPATSNYSDTFFKSHVSLLGKGSSFPSGHAAAIFSVAPRTHPR